MTNEAFFPHSRNLSVAWTEVFLKLMDRGVEKLAPVIVTVTEFDDKTIPREHTAIAKRLDQELRIHNCYSCQTVANTIFPESLWNPSLGAQAVFERYEKIWPRIKKHRRNSHGVYFRRLTAFSPKQDIGTSARVNQLEHIIDTYKQGNHRVSALQASIFDPTHDHTHGRQLGFPCLQQVAFVPDGDAGLSVTGFYATQYAFERAYGNFQGLCRLGRFMAAQMGLSLVQMTCIAAVTRRSDPKRTKGDLRMFADDLQQLLSNIKKESR